MDGVMPLGPLGRKLEAFGAAVSEVDGHDVKALVAAGLRRSSGLPHFVIAHTDPCRGIEELAARRPKLHYVRLKNDQERQALQKALERLKNGAS